MTHRRLLGRSFDAISTLGLRALPRVAGALAVSCGAALAEGGPLVLPEGFSVARTIDVGATAVGFAELPDGRMLVVGHRTGNVELVVEDVLVPTPIFVVPDLLDSSEQGLLGIAIDPDFPGESYVYLFHTHIDSTNRVTRFALTGDLTDGSSQNLSIDAGSAMLLWSGPSRQRFHNGGTLRFGSDKTLYISHGDDAFSRGNVQNLEQLHGKLLRINRDGSIPEDNPVFPEEPPGMREEIFAFGFRNPFRFCIDPSTDDLFVGDVGGTQVDELSLCRGGENFGYPYWEGSEIFRDKTVLLPPEPTFPIFEFAHGPNNHAIISLVCYRLPKTPTVYDFPAEYDGRVFHSDFFGTTLSTLRPDGGGEWTNEPFGTGFAQSADAALARDGGVLILQYGSRISHIVYDGVVPVIFLAFDARQEGASVRLDWRVTEPARTFEILRSRDGVSFESVATVPGGDVGPASRSFVDASPAPVGADVYYKVVLWTYDDEQVASPVERVTIMHAPSRVLLFQNEPNPFGATTKIDFGVPEASSGGPVLLEIFDVLGRAVQTLERRTLPAGRHGVTWDGRDATGAALPSGVYFYRLTHDNTVLTRKLVLQR